MHVISCHTAPSNQIIRWLMTRMVHRTWLCDVTVKVFARPLSPTYVFFAKITLNIIDTESKPITCIACPVDITKITSHNRHRHCHSSTHRSQCVCAVLGQMCRIEAKKKCEHCEMIFLIIHFIFLFKCYRNMFPWSNQKDHYWFR